MENKIIKYPIFAFEVDGNGRTGIVLVAATYCFFKFI